MKSFDKHFLLNLEDAVAYVKAKELFPADASLVAEEIGDGNINYIFRVRDVNSGKSIVLKQADVLLRSSGRPLDVIRNKIEAEILKIQHRYAPTQVPEIVLYDDIMCIIAMEDISAFKNLRKELASEKIFVNFAEEVSSFLANIFLPTTDLVVDPGKKKDYVRDFINKELCDISECLVFSEPYLDDKGRNIILEGNKEYVAETLYKDLELHAEVAKLRINFMNNAQALIHGDLHSGSIFINEDGVKVIDPEFAFYGPIGYDIGNVIGNLLFAYVNKKYTMEAGEKKVEFLTWIKESIVKIIDLFILKFMAKYDEVVKYPLYQTKGFKEYYLDSIISDTFGYAGTEIIRRVVGDAKVSEVTSIKDEAVRIVVERELIEIGKVLIKRRNEIRNGIDLVRNTGI